MPVKQPTRSGMTVSSLGFHLGRMPENPHDHRGGVRSLAGRQGARQALDNAVERGNKMLRYFQKSVHT